MEYFMTKLRKMKKLLIAFSLILTMCVASVNTTVQVAYAGSMQDVEDSLGLSQNNAQTGTTNVIGNIVSIISMIARVVGILLGVYGLYKLIVAFKDQDANGITQGIGILAVGVILIMFKTIASAIFGITVN